MIITFLLLIAGWLMAAVLFEAGYQALKGNGHIQIQKVQACRLWWFALGVVSCLSGTTACLFNLPLIVLIGASHIDLAGHKNDVIRLVEILKNIPSALRKTGRALRQFIG